jgi:hypothetical protein
MFSFIITTRYWDAGNAMRIHWCAEFNVPKSDAMQVRKSVYQENRLVTMLSSQRETKGEVGKGGWGGCLVKECTSGQISCFLVQKD